MAQLSANDLLQLQEKGITEAQLQAELDCFRQGFPYLRLEASAGIGRGITVPTDTDKAAWLAAWEAYLQADHQVVKFVPASGAASRMFKNLFAFLNGPADTPQTDFEKTFFDRIQQFAFIDLLNQACLASHGADVAALVAQGQYKAVVAALLGADGLNYGELPKGLLKFHRADDGVRTPAEEHLVEGALYARTSDGQVNIHFTVSHSHLPLFQALIEERAEAIGGKYGVTFHVSFSEQKPSTDTVAVTPDNALFRTDDGRMLFRPGGHGSLIENLGELDCDVAFIKNIDNVVPDKLKTSSVEQKKMMAGLLVKTQAEVFAMLRELDAQPSEARLQQMLAYVEQTLHVTRPGAPALQGEALAAYLRGKLNRPIRVCAMVRNEGEPGGGPFLAYGQDGTVQLQILESSQINVADAHCKALFEQGSHFNPVDLVCGLRDYTGQSFALQNYVDEQTGFISSKSAGGRELKALERPGLWNGAMSDWITLFIEATPDTFNPVKTVNDLLRPQHQA